MNIKEAEIVIKRNIAVPWIKMAYKNSKTNETKIKIAEKIEEINNKNKNKMHTDFKKGKV